MTKKIVLPSNEILLYVLSAATAVTLAWALIYIDGGQTDPAGQALVLVRGGLVGFVSGLATAIVSNRAQRVKAQGPKQWASYSLAGMLGAELVVVSFVTYATMNPAMAFLWWPFRALVALCAGALIPVIAVGLASTSGALQAEAQAEQAVAQGVQPGAQGETAPAKQSKKVAKTEPPAFTDENLIAQYILNPISTNAALAKVFEVSPQAVSSRRLALEKQHRISKVGNEIKVMPAFVVQEAQ